jgi:hypothetical protein
VKNMYICIYTCIYIVHVLFNNIIVSYDTLILLAEGNMSVENRWNGPTTCSNTILNVSLSTKNFIQTALGLNSGLHVDGLALIA